MEHTEKLLKLLNDGRFHSGEVLGSALGISRAAIWKQLQALTALGLQIDSVKGKGYRLHRGVELLDQARIVAALDPQLNTDVHICWQTTSTNDWVRSIPLRHNGVTRIVGLAEYQSSGRGRRGRSWQNPLGSTISLSMRWFYRAGMASLEGLSLAVGYGVLKALEDCGADNLKLKWPNDVLWQSAAGLQKLSGILLEVHGDPTGECEVIIGIGVNIALSQAQLESIDQPAVDMQRVCGRTISRNQVASALISRLCQVLDTFSEQGFAGFRERWQRYDAFADQEVVVDVSGRQVVGTAAGVTDQGGLLLHTPDGMMTINGGEVSLKAAQRPKVEGQA